MIGPADPHAEDVVLAATSLTPGQSLELGRRDGSREPQLDLVVGQVAQPLHAVHLDQQALADDRHPVARALHLAQDVAG